MKIHIAIITALVFGTSVSTAEICCSRQGAGTYAGDVQVPKVWTIASFSFAA